MYNEAEWKYHFIDNLHLKINISPQFFSQSIEFYSAGLQAFTNLIEKPN